MAVCSPTAFRKDLTRFSNLDNRYAKGPLALQGDTQRAKPSQLQGLIAAHCLSRARRHAALPFGVAVIDSHLPAGSLLLGAVHEIAEAGPAAEHAPLAALFTGGILARLPGPVL